MMQRFTTLVTAAATYDLVDLPTLKTELSIPTDKTADDAWLQQAIRQVSGSISRYCNRSGSESAQASFPVEIVQDLFYPERDAYPYQVPGGADVLQLSHWPVVPITTLLTSADTPSGNVLTFASTALPNAGAPPVDGVDNIAAAISAGQPVNGLNIDASVTVSSLTPTSVTLSKPILGDIPAATPINFGISIAITDPPNSSPQGLVQGTDFVVDTTCGHLTKLDTFMAYPTMWMPVKTVVLYASGYAPLPDDLIDAALRWLTMRWKDRGRDPALKSIEQPLVGTYNYWVGGPKTTGGVPEEIAELLDAYRVPVAL